MAEGPLRGQRVKLLAVSPVPLWPDTNGYALRVVSLVRELAAWWDIVLVAAESPLEEDRTSSLGVLDYRPMSGRGNIATMPWQLETERLEVEAVRAARETRPACVLLWAGIEFLAGDLDVPLALGDRIDCATLAQLRHARGSPTLRGRWESLKAAAQAAAYERRIVRKLDVTTVVGEADARVLDWISGRSSVHVVPNGATTGAPPDYADETDHPSVIFSGALGFEPNAEAAHFFASEVFPEVRARFPDAEFIIAGFGEGATIMALSDLPGVEVRSNVPDMGKEISAAWVAVAPMRSGGGIKNKVLEAWATGTPVVMTSMATNGLGTEFGRASIVADKPSDLASAVVRLLSDTAERRRLGQAGYDLVRTRHTWRRAAETITGLLRGAPGTLDPTPAMAGGSPADPPSN